MFLYYYIHSITMLSDNLNEEIPEKFESNIFNFKRSEDVISYRLDKDNYSQKTISSKLSEMKDDYEFLYSTTIDDDDILCILVKDSDDPRFYIHNILTSLDVDEYSERLIQAEKVSNGLDNKYSFDDPFYIAVLSVYLMTEDEYTLDHIYKQINVEQDINEFVSKIKDMKIKVEEDILSKSGESSDNDFRL